MNKKFYFAPEMEELEMETLGMLCVSGDPDPDSGEAPMGEEEI
jgi:hypothetical protein